MFHFADASRDFETNVARAALRCDLAATARFPRPPDAEAAVWRAHSAERAGESRIRLAAGLPRPRRSRSPTRRGRRSQSRSRSLPEVPSRSNSTVRPATLRDVRRPLAAKLRCHPRPYSSRHACSLCTFQARALRTLAAPPTDSLCRRLRCQPQSVAPSPPPLAPDAAATPSPLGVHSSFSIRSRASPSRGRFAKAGSLRAPGQDAAVRRSIFVGNRRASRELPGPNGATSKRERERELAKEQR